LKHHNYIGPIPVGKIAEKAVCQKRTPSDCFFGDSAHWE